MELNRQVSLRKLETRHSILDWEKLKKTDKSFYDDGTLSFFWRAHTLTVLFCLVSVLVYVAAFEPISDDKYYNAKRGLIAVIYTFTLVGVIVTPDGPFLRPHPAIWRFTFCCSIVYESVLIFLLFQAPKDARELLWHISPELGVPLEEKSYSNNCLIYDPDYPEDPFHNVWDKMDIFVPCHFIGWFLKTLVMRDWWLCTVISVMFELLEYTLEHQLPNFSECWWDHWLLDALICNGLGILLGIITLNYFSIKTYYWRGLWNIPGYRGKLKRIIAQFGPYSWIDFDWKPTSSLGRWLSVLAIITVFLLAELNTFYLKFVLWIPPDHNLNLVRLFFFLLWGAIGMRETFQYLDDPECSKFGRQSWLVFAVVITEFLLIVKFGWATITKPLPRPIALSWVIGLGCLALYTLYMYFLKWKVESFLRRMSKNQESTEVMSGLHSKCHSD